MKMRSVKRRGALKFAKVAMAQVSCTLSLSSSSGLAREDVKC